MAIKSGLQKEVLALYRRSLRMAKNKPESSRPKFLLYVRHTFHVNAKVSPRNVGAIEHLIRKGTKQIEMYEDPSVKDCWVSQDMVDWQASQIPSTGRTSAQKTP